MSIVQQLNWILYLSTVGCVCECKAAVLYHINLIIVQLECTYLPAPLCAYTVGNFFHIWVKTIHYAEGRLKKEAKASLSLFLWHNENMSQCSYFPFHPVLKFQGKLNHFLEAVMLQNGVKERGRIKQFKPE